jgi:outer membrane biosynthesis protein TonB
MSQHPLGSSLFPVVGAFFIATLGCLGMLFIMTQTQESSRDDSEPEILVRSFAITPPTPPLPQQQKPRAEQEIQVPSLSSPKTNSTVTLEISPIDKPLDFEFVPNVNVEMGDTNFELDMNQDIGVALKTKFEFEDMDEQPRLLHNGDFSFPKDLLRRRITKGKVELFIEINEEGKASVLRVVSSDYRQLVPLAKRMVSTAKFSVPTFEGRAVKTTGVWPVTLEAPR